MQSESVSDDIEDVCFIIKFVTLLTPLLRISKRFRQKLIKVLQLRSIVNSYFYTHTYTHKLN